MDIDQAISTISMLPISDRLRVIHAIWDSLPEDLVLPLSEQQQAEIDRRLQAHEDNPGSAIGHDELMRENKESSLMWHIICRPEVEDDLAHAALWYDQQMDGLGDRFIEEYLIAIRRIQKNPLHFAIGQHGLRNCLLKRFSYVIHFRVDDSSVLIVAVMNGARDDLSVIQRIDE